MSRSATCSMVSSMLAIRRGVEGADTMRRRRAWRGLSVEIMPAKYSTISWGRSTMLSAPWPEQKISGCRLTSVTSAWRVTAR